MTDHPAKAENAPVKDRCVVAAIKGFHVWALSSSVKDLPDCWDLSQTDQDEVSAEIVAFLTANQKG
jgi:hypothetical protein